MDLYWRPLRQTTKRCSSKWLSFCHFSSCAAERFDEWFAGENSFQTSWWKYFSLLRRFLISPPYGNSLPEDPLHLDCFLGLQHRSNKKGQKRWLFPTSVSKRKRKPNSEKHNLPTWNPKHSRSLSSKIQPRTAIVRTATHWLGLQQEWR